jgi:hypothetical protein
MGKHEEINFHGGGKISKFSDNNGKFFFGSQDI